MLASARYSSMGWGWAGLAGLFAVCASAESQRGALSPTTMQGSPLLAEVPFTLHRNAVIVKCVVGGRDTVQMLLDTGWGPLALTNTAARRLGLTATSAGGDMVARASSFGIGRALRRDVAFELFPPEALQPLIGPFDGVLSTGFLHHFVVQIDYPRGVVRLFSRMPAAGGGPDRPRVQATMPMVFSPAAGYLPFTDSAFVNGERVRALFDTEGERRVHGDGAADESRNARDASRHGAPRADRHVRQRPTQGGATPFCARTQHFGGRDHADLATRDRGARSARGRELEARPHHRLRVPSGFRGDVRLSGAGDQPRTAG